MDNSCNTATTAATPNYQIATGGNLTNISVGDNVNLITNDTSFNTVKYKAAAVPGYSPAGAIIGSRSNLEAVILGTNSGESAIYAMSTDETAGTTGPSLLDGDKLTIQGNGNTITNNGIIVGDGANSTDLTLKDTNMDIEGRALQLNDKTKVTIQAQNNLNGNKPIRIYTRSGYAHGIGLFEVHYILSDISTPQPGKKEVFKLIIQVQGDRYCHMVCYDDIVDDGGQELSVNASALSDAWKTAANIKPKDIKDTLANYISIDGSTPKFHWLVDTSWGKYGENLIYQYVEIPPTATIQDVIDAMAKDIKKIKGWFSPIKDILY